MDQATHMIRRCSGLWTSITRRDHGATVKLQIMSWSGFIERIQTAIAAGSPPDVTTAAYYGLMNYAAMGESAGPDGSG